MFPKRVRQRRQIKGTSRNFDVAVENCFVTLNYPKSSVYRCTVAVSPICLHFISWTRIHLVVLIILNLQPCTQNLVISRNQIFCDSLARFAFRRVRNSILYIPYSMCVLFLLFLVNDDELELHCFHNRIIWFSANFTRYRYARLLITQQTKKKLHRCILYCNIDFLCL